MTQKVNTLFIKTDVRDFKKFFRWYFELFTFLNPQLFSLKLLISFLISLFYVQAGSAPQKRFPSLWDSEVHRTCFTLQNL